jgi:hypothetical protein
MQATLESTIFRAVARASSDVVVVGESRIPLFVFFFFFICSVPISACPHAHDTRAKGREGNRSRRGRTYQPSRKSEEKEEEKEDIIKSERKRETGRWRETQQCK